MDSDGIWDGCRLPAATPELNTFKTVETVVPRNQFIGMFGEKEFLLIE